MQFANGCRSVVGKVVFERDEKDSIVILLFMIQLGTQFIGPLGRLIGPVSRPLLVTPGVSQLEQPKLLPFVLDFMDCQDGVGMI